MAGDAGAGRWIPMVNVGAERVAASILSDSRGAERAAMSVLAFAAGGTILPATGCVRVGADAQTAGAVVAHAPLAAGCSAFGGGRR